MAMQSKDVIADGFGRVRNIVHAAVADLTPDQLAFRVDPDANTVAWLVWHLTRVQDSHLAELIGSEQVWTAAGWVDRYGLPFDRLATGYGHSSEEVAAVHADAAILADYHDAVLEQTHRYVAGLSDGELDDIVDRSYDPPVSRGVRLVSVIADNLQHAGQAAFVRGIVLRRR
jgi:hypothetical protein